MGVAVPQEAAGRGNRGGRVSGTWLEEEPASCECWMERASRHRRGANRSPGGRRDGAAGLHSAALWNGSVADGSGTACHRKHGESVGGRGWTQIWAQ